MKLMKDYKNIQLISQFTSPFSGKLVTRERSNLCIKGRAFVDVLDHPDFIAENPTFNP